MNTTASTQSIDTTTAIEATESAANSPSGKPGRARAALVRVLVGLATVLGLAMGASVVAAPAASAATSYAYVTVCFQSSYSPQVFGTDWVGRAVYYVIQNPSTRAWTTLQVAYTGTNGCVRFTVHAGYATYFQAYENWGSYYLSAQSPVYTYAAGYQYNLPRYSVMMTRIG